MESGLYEGVVAHERLTPVRHRFQYRLFLAYLDLAELPMLLSTGVISHRTWGLAAFRRADHLGAAGEPLEETIRNLVRKNLGRETGGPIRMLAQLSCLGTSFSPLSLFYCFDQRGELVAVVAEVSNTPWLERHAYVVPCDGGEHRLAKEFHVSPFLSMEMDYLFRFGPPGETLRVEIENHARGELLFRAALSLRRRELTRGHVNQMTLRYPLQPLRITTAIYFQAYQLWRRRCPYYPHPSRSRLQSPRPSSRTARPDKEQTPAPACGNGHSALRSCDDWPRSGPGGCNSETGSA